MDLFWILLPVQLLALISVRLVLRRNFPQSVVDIFSKNSTRSDGSFSQGRYQKERESFNWWLKRVDGGLVFVFLLTTVAALAAAEFKFPLPNLTGWFSYENQPMFLEPTSEMPFPSMRWPVVAVYAIGSFVCAPMIILYLYRSALNKYRARANARFLDYYRQGYEKAQQLVNSGLKQEH